MPDKKNTTSNAAMPAVLAGREIRTMPTTDDVVRIDAVHHVPDVHPNRPGPWSAEADKLAWSDKATGYACIVRRNARHGHLCGHVAVPPAHPLFGMPAEARVGLHIAVHNGINYAEACEEDEPESRSVCHPRPDRPDEDGSEVVHREGDLEGRDAWWFGFACDGPSDVVPNEDRRRPAAHPLDGIVGRVYRDEAFLIEETTRLARQLRAVQDGCDPVEVVVPRGHHRTSAPRRGRA